MSDELTGAPTKGRRVDVVVVGAGLAGLRAATDLVAVGRRVMVLEARDRVGGRVWSHHFANGQWCERGAEFIDANHTEVLGLAADLGLDLLDVASGADGDARRLLDVGGRVTPFALHHTLHSELARWREAMDLLAASVDPDHPTDGELAGVLDETALSSYLSALQLSPLTRVVVGRALRTEYMVGPDEVSQLMAAWMTARHRRAGEGFEAYRIAGGNDQLATGLAAGLGDRVHLGAAVVDLDADTGAVTLADRTVVMADEIVATLPLPVLGRVWQDMPTVLAAAGYGIGGKVSVQTSRRIWHDYGRSGSVVTDRAWGELWDTSERQPGDAGVLTALLSSHDGAALASLPDTAERVVGEAERIFPGFKGLAGERVQTDWTHDPHSLGCYVTYGPGQMLAAWPALHRRYGRLRLGGEHTDAFSGYMEGALRSGARVAAEIRAGR